MTREIYWNVGHGVVLPMYLLVFVAVGIMVWGFYKRLSLYQQGKPLNRFDQKGLRFKRMVTEVIGQVRVRRVTSGGLPHSLFLWGFIVLFIGTLLVMVQADFVAPVLNKNILSGPFYLVFSLLLDLAGLLTIIMLLGLFIRRFFIKPAGLDIETDDYWIYGLLFSILISGFLIEGVRIAAVELVLNPGLTKYSPVGLIIAKGLSGWAPASLASLHQSLWWFHFVLVLGFIAALPYSKLKHIFLTSANAFFAPLEEKGSIATIDLEDEEIEQFGAAKIADLSWKDIFDADACTSCNRCQDRCPAYNTDKPLSPMRLVKQIGEVAALRPDAELVAELDVDAIWACTTCGACQDICPANNEHVNKVIEVRRNLSLMEGEFPGDEVRTAISHLEVNGNPFGMAFASRGDWAEGLDIANLSAGEDADILYFTGCYASFDKRNQTVARNFIQICQAAGIKVGILGKDEKCCGEPARKLGNEYIYQMLAMENIEQLQATGVKKIVTSCPHCFNTLSRDYRDLGFEIETEHYTTYLNTLLNNGKLKINSEGGQDCTYHDSCYLGRYKDIVAEPRRLLQAAGWNIREMDKSGYDSFCCSAGGGRIFAEEKLGTRINVARVEQATETGANILVSNCPFCLTMFEDGIKTGGCEEKLEVRDITEIIVDRIGG